MTENAWFPVTMNPAGRIVVGLKIYRHGPKNHWTMMKHWAMKHSTMSAPFFGMS